MAGELKTNIVIALINNVTAPLKEITNNFEALRTAGKQMSAAFDWGMKLNQSADGARRVSAAINRLTEGPLALAKTEETSLIALRRSTGLTEDAFNKLYAQMSGKAAGTEFIGADVVSGMAAMTANGMEAGKAIGELGHMMDFASVSHMSLAQSSELVSGLLKKFKGPAEDAGKYTDMLAKAAQIAPKAGLSGIGEALKEVAGTAERFHVPFETTLSLLTEFIKTSGSAEKAALAFESMYSHATTPIGVAQMQKAPRLLSEKGINIAGNKNNLPALLAEVTAKTTVLSDASRALASHMIFGDASIISYTKIAGPDGLGAVTDSLKIATGAMKVSADLEDGTAEQAHKRYEAATKRLGEAFGRTLVPGAKAWDNLLGSITSKAADLATQHNTLTGSMMLVTKAAGWGASAISGAGTAASGLASAFAVINGIKGVGTTTKLLAPLIAKLTAAKLAAFGLQAGVTGVAVAATTWAAGTWLEVFKRGENFSKKNAEIANTDNYAKARRVEMELKALPVVPLVPLVGGAASKGRVDFNVKIDSDGKVKSTTVTQAGDFPWGSSNLGWAVP